MRKLIFGMMSLGLLAAGIGSGQKQAVYVIVTGGARGNLAPCGCTKPMSGGLKRLGTMVRELKTRYGATWIDVGDVTNEPGRQSELKYEAYGQFLGQLGVSAFVVSQRDSQLGSGLVMSYQSLAKGVALTSEGRTQFVDRGLRYGFGPGADVSVGTSPNAKVEIVTSGGAAYAEGRRVSPGEGLRGLVLLKFVNRKLVSSVAIPLESKVADDPATNKAFASYLRRVTQERLVDRLPRQSGGDFVGSTACASCHAEAAKVHFKSKHAHALATLTAEGHQADPDCLSCHTVGFGYEGGFVLEKAASFGEVGCESCHGAGKLHSENPQSHKLGLVGEKVCLTCHTSKTSPTFNFLTYWKQISHR